MTEIDTSPEAVADKVAQILARAGRPLPRWELRRQLHNSQRPYLSAALALLGDRVTVADGRYGLTDVVVDTAALLVTFLGQGSAVGWRHTALKRRLPEPLRRHYGDAVQLLVRGGYARLGNHGIVPITHNVA